MGLHFLPWLQMRRKTYFQLSVAGFFNTIEETHYEMNAFISELILFAAFWL